MQPEFLIFGDSHANALSAATASQGIPYAGGMMLSGRIMNDHFFKIDKNKFVLLSERHARKLARILHENDLEKDLLDVDIPILSTVGFNTHNFESAFRAEGLSTDPSGSNRFISAACFESAAAGARRGALEFYRALAQAGRTVYAVPSPQRFTPDGAVVCQAFEAVLIRQLSSIGVGIIDVRAQTTDSAGILLSRFESTRSDDWVHANAEFGAIVIEKFRQTVAKPRRELVPSPPLVDRIATYVHTQLAALSA